MKPLANLVCFQLINTVGDLWWCWPPPHETHSFWRLFCIVIIAEEHEAEEQVHYMEQTISLHKVPVFLADYVRTMSDISCGSSITSEHFQQYFFVLKDVFILKECNSEGFLEGLRLFKNQTRHLLFISVMVCLDFWVFSLSYRKPLTLLPYSVSFFHSSLFFTDLFLCILPNTGPCSFSLNQ